MMFQNRWSHQLPARPCGTGAFTPVGVHLDKSTDTLLAPIVVSNMQRTVASSCLAASGPKRAVGSAVAALPEPPSRSCADVGEQAISVWDAFDLQQQYISDELVEVGYIWKPLGIRGEVAMRVRTSLQDMRVGLAGTRYILPAVSKSATHGPEPLADHPPLFRARQRLARQKLQAGHTVWLALLDGCCSREAAEQLQYARVFMRRQDCPSLNDSLTNVATDHPRINYPSPRLPPPPSAVHRDAMVLDVTHGRTGNQSDPATSRDSSVLWPLQNSTKTQGTGLGDVRDSASDFYPCIGPLRCVTSTVPMEVLRIMSAEEVRGFAAHIAAPVVAACGGARVNDNAATLRRADGSVCVGRVMDIIRDERRFYDTGEHVRKLGMEDLPGDCAVFRIAFQKGLVLAPLGGFAMVDTLERQELLLAEGTDELREQGRLSNGATPLWMQSARSGLLPLLPQHVLEIDHHAERILISVDVMWLHGHLAPRMVKRRPPRRTDKAKQSMGNKYQKRRDKAFIRKKGKYAKKGRNMRKT